MPPVLAVSICASRRCCKCRQSVFVSVVMPPVLIDVSICISRGCCWPVWTASQYLYQTRLLPVCVVSICICRPCPSVGSQYLDQSSMPPLSVVGAASNGSQYLCLSSMPPVLVAVRICINRGSCQCGQSVFVSVIHDTSIGSRQ